MQNIFVYLFYTMNFPHIYGPVLKCYVENFEFDVK